MTAVLSVRWTPMAEELLWEMRLEAPVQGED